MIITLNGINEGILIFFIFSAILYTLLLVGAFPAIVEFFNRATLTNLHGLVKNKTLPPVTIMISIYNEEAIVVESVMSALRSDYKNFYLMLINDGSTDNTLDVLIQTFDLRKEPLIFDDKIKTAPVKAVYVSNTHAHLMLIDKEHSGVGDSLNVGLNACFTPYFMSMDADSTLDERAVSELMFELMSHSHTIGVGGGVYIRNACEYKDGVMLESNMPYRLVPALQSNEYLRSHLFSRTGWNKFGASMSYSGTASLFNLHAVLDAKGYDTQNYAQDTEMVMRLHHHLHEKKQVYQIRFNPAATVWTDVPRTLRRFTIQRDRWQRGMLRSALHYMGMFLNPKYKIQGLFSFPVYVLLEIMAPFVEVTAYITLSLAYYWGILNGLSAILYILLAWGFTTYLTLANMFINLITFNRYKRPMDILWMLVLAFIEMFGFRQYHTLVRLYGSLHYCVNRMLGKAL